MYYLNLIRLLLPLCILGYFLVKARHQPIFLLGIPFLMAMGNSIFFDYLKPFWIPGRITAPVNIFIWLVLVWFLLVSIGHFRQGRRLYLRDFFGPPVHLPEDVIIGALALIWLFNSSASIYNTKDFEGVLLTCIRIGGLFLGFLMMRGIVAKATRKDLDSFLLALILTNCIAAILHILDSGFNLSFYQQIVSSDQQFQGITIERSFWFLPRFYNLTFVYIFSRSKWKLYFWIILAINLISIFFTYTRTTLVFVAGISVLAIILTAVKRNVFKALRRTIITVLAAVMLYTLIYSFYPVQLLFLIDRFVGQDISKLSTDGTFAIRVGWVDNSIRLIGPDRIWLGLGMETELSNPAAVYILPWTADITWVGILFRFGMLGVGLILFLFIALGIRTLQNYFKARDPGQEEYWLLFFLLVVITFSETFFSWTFLDPRNYTLGFWFVAFIVSKIGDGRSIYTRNKKTLKMLNKSLSDQIPR